MRPLWLVLVALGLRRGEALGLRWEDVDLEAGTVRVGRSLQRLRDGEPDPFTGRRTGRLVVSDKTKNGRTAVLALPAAVTMELERHRREQLRERLAAPVWVNAGLVFATRAGTALEPRNVSRSWSDLCDQADVRRIRIHDLRHTAASLLLAQGVDLEVVQTTLRHTRLSTTADISTHVQADVQCRRRPHERPLAGLAGARLSGAATCAARSAATVTKRPRPKDEAAGQRCALGRFEPATSDP